jgi:hypothetical protein
MSVSGISSGSVAAAYTPPPAQQAQQAPAPQKAATADTVSISKMAQQLASDGDTQAKEVSESGAEKAGESLRGKA